MSQVFPKSWFYIKHQNGYVLAPSQKGDGAFVVLAALKTANSDDQLWRHDDEGHLINKDTGLVMDVTKGNIKAGTDVVVQKRLDGSSATQTYALSAEGHICLKEKPEMVLGIKESFFSRREGLHLHLQADDKRSKDQHWNFVLPAGSSSSSSTSNLQRTSSSSTVGSSKPSSKGVTQIKEDDARSVKSASSAGPSLDNEASQKLAAGVFPETPFFLKSKQTGLFIGTEASSMSQAGGHLTVDTLRKKGYESQLWYYDAETGRVVNKHSNYVLSVEALKEDAYACQTKPSGDPKLQTWTLTNDNEICLKHDPSWVLGLKESWFSLNREGARVHVQQKGKNHEQKFTVALPIFKTHTIKHEDQPGKFPEGWFFVKSQETGLALTILDTKIGSDIVAAKINTQSYSRQLWRHKSGFLINKATNTVLDVRGGSLVKNTALCHYDQKKHGSENQMWGLTKEGFIHVQCNRSLVLSVQKADASRIYLAERRSGDHKEQRWNFVLPVFKKKQAQRAAIKSSQGAKAITYRYAQLPSSWFFIRSFVDGSTKESPLVLSVNKETNNVFVTRLSHEHWHYQLWSYTSGVLVNYGTGLAIDVNDLQEGGTLKLGPVQPRPQSQRWKLSIDGYLVHGTEPTLTLAPHADGESNFKLSLVQHASYKEEHRWGLLIPEIRVENSIQILVRWSVAMLEEWRQKTLSQQIKPAVHTAAWPQDSFFITTQDGYALAPEKPEASAFVELRKVDSNTDCELYKWAFIDGYLTHCATGLVLHAHDAMTSGDRLQLRAKLISDDKRADERQLWTLKTNGVIASDTRANLGLGLIKSTDGWQVQVTDYKKTAAHYNWNLRYGQLERRYNEVHKKEILVLISWEVIILMIASRRGTSRSQRKLVTQQYGIFPSDWFFIRSKNDKSLVITTTNKKEGARLTLQKLNLKDYKRQLWRCEDDGCLTNMESSLVIDVAGGKISADCNVIQWHEKFLWRSRKNQQWGLSVEGHIHPRSRPGLVLNPKGNEVREGVDLQLQPRGVLSAEYQQWTFAQPRYGAKTLSRTSTMVEDIGEATLQVGSREEYERVAKYTVVRRWGVFPEGNFFIRVNYGDGRYGLTVERQAKTGTHGDEYAVTVRPMNFKEHKWQYWSYDDGHIVNVQTGLALDAEAVSGILVEYGLKSQLHVREATESESQFWALSVDGEIHLRSNERMVVSVAAGERASVDGAQVGLAELQIQKTVENGRQQVTYNAKPWMKWGFSYPVYGKRASSKEQAAIAVAGAAIASGTAAEEGEIQGTEEQDLKFVEEEESGAEDSDTEEEDSDSEEEDDDDSIASGASKATSVAHTDRTRKQSSSSNSSRSSRSSRLDVFTSTNDYIPTGFEKVVRFKNHTGAFPPAGFFLIKSDLHGYVLDVEGDVKSGVNAVLTRIKSSDYASQLWSFRRGHLVNLKGETLVLDATRGSKLVAGEHVHLSEQETSVRGTEQQLWEFTADGLIHLKAKRSFVLSVKELKRSDAHKKIDVFVQEEKTHGNTKTGPRREQRWEILVPSLIPEQPKTETGVKIVEAGKKSISAVLAFKWFKLLQHQPATADEEVPRSKCFLIRFGNENRYLAAGQQRGQVGLYELNEQEDYKRYLWIYVDGYLVNYKYMLRLVYIQSQGWVLVDAHEHADQKVTISSAGLLTVRTTAITYYLRIVCQASQGYQLEATTDEESAKDQMGLQSYIAEFTEEGYAQDAQQAVADVLATTQKDQSQKVTHKTTTTVTVRRAFFPANASFFIKVDLEGKDHLVLAVEGDGDKARLVIKKLDYKDFRRQLWGFYNGLLINYGSEYAIDAHDGADALTQLVLTPKSTARLNWFLTVDGLIRVHKQETLALGYANDLKENISVVLAGDQGHALRWKFSTPVFGKKKVASGAVVSAGAVAAAIEEGDSIEGIEDIHIEAEKHEDKKSSTESALGAVAIGAGVAGIVGAAAGAITHEKKQSEQETQKATHKTSATVTVRRAFFPANASFFIKVDIEGKDHLVLAMEGDGDKARLVVKKLDYKDFRRQLWGFDNGFLINYGSEYAIDAHGATNALTQLVLTPKSTARLNWFLTVDGLIRVHKQETLALGYTNDLKENISVVLAGDQGHALRWKFSTPVFGKKKIASGAVVSAGAIAAAIEEGDSIEGVEDIHIEAEEDKETSGSAVISSGTAAGATGAAVAIALEKKQSEQETQKVAHKTTTTVTVRRAFFPDNASFFIKVDLEGKDHLVLAVEDNGDKARLVIKKLDYKDFRRQLWGFYNGFLVNYGSECAIDARGETNALTQLVLTPKSTACLNWFLTVDGLIRVHKQETLALGYANDLKENISVVLAGDQGHALRWKFSTPVFGKKKVASGAVVSAGAVAAAIEEGDSIEGVEDIHIEVEEQDSEKYDHKKHDHKKSSTEDEVESVAIGAGIAAGLTAAAGAGWYLGKKISEHENDKEQKEAHKLPKKDEGVTDSKTTLTKIEGSKATAETTVVSKKTTLVTVTTATWTIIRSWRIVFIQRLRQCKTKAETVAAIEEMQRLLNQRLDSHYNSQSAAVSKTAEWRASIDQVKEHFHLHLFGLLLGKVASLKDSDKVTLEELDVQTALDDACTDVQQKENALEAAKSATDVHSAELVKKVTEVDAKEDLLITVTSIKTTIHFWFLDLQGKISHARKNGASEQDIKMLVETAHKDLTAQLQHVRVSIHSSQSWTILGGSPNDVTSAQQKIVASIDKIQSQLDEQIPVICTTHEVETSDKWSEIVNKVDNHVDAEIESNHKALAGFLSAGALVVAAGATGSTGFTDTSIVSDNIKDTRKQISSWYGQLMSQLTQYTETCDLKKTDAKEDLLLLADGAKVDFLAIIKRSDYAIQHAGNLSETERRRFVYLLESTKAQILAYLLRFRIAIDTSTELTKETVTQSITYTFGPDAQNNTLHKLEEAALVIVGGSVIAGELTGDKAATATSAHGTVGKSAPAQGSVTEEIAATVRGWFGRLKDRVSKRAKQGGDKTNEDIEKIIAEAKSELAITLDQKKQHYHKVGVVDIPTLEETLVHVQQTVSVQTEEIKKIAQESSTLDDEEFCKRVSAACDTSIDKTSIEFEKLKPTHHGDKTKVTITEEKSSKITSKPATAVTTAGAAFVIGETVKAVHGWLFGLIDRASVDKDFGKATSGFAAEETDLVAICEQAKTQISTADVSTTEKEEYLALIETIRTTANSRLTEVKTVAASTTDKNAVAAKLKLIADSSKQDLDKHIEKAKIVCKPKPVVAVESHQDSEKEKHKHEAPRPVGPAAGVMHDFSHDHKKEDHHHGLKTAAGVAGAIALGGAAAAIAHEVKKHHDEAKHEDAHKAALATKKAEDHIVQAIPASKTPTELSSNVHTWYAAFVAQLGAQITQQGTTHAQIDALVRAHLTVVIEHIRVSRQYIISSVAAEDQKQELLAALDSVQETITQTSNDIKTVAVQVIAGQVKHDKLKETAASHESKIQQVLHDCDTKKDASKKDEKAKESEVIKIHHTDNDVAIVGGALVAVGAIDYLKTTISSWYKKLTSDVAKSASHGGNAADIETIIAKANDNITVELNEVASKAKKSHDKAAVSKLTETITWAQGMVKQSSNQIQAIGVQVIASGESEESAHAKMAPLVKATEEQIHTALVQCSEVTIDVSEKEKTTAAIVASPATHGKVTHKEETTKTEERPSSTAGGVAVVGGAVVAVGAAEYIRTTITAWYKKLTFDIAGCAGKGEAGKQEAEEIIRKANEEIVAELKHVSSKTDSIADKDTATKLTTTIDWAQDVVKKNTTEVQAVAVEIIASGISKEQAQEKLTEVTKSTEEKVHAALKEHKDVKIEVEAKKPTICHKDQHKAAGEKHSHDTGKTVAGAAVVAGTLAAVGAVAYIKSVLSSWNSKLVSDVSKCAAHGGNAADIQKIVAKANEEITLELNNVSSKTEKVQGKASADKLTETIGWAQDVIKQSSTQVEAIGIQVAASGESEESARLKMVPLVTATEEQVHTALGQCSEVTIEVADKSKPAAAVIVAPGTHSEITITHEKAAHSKPSHHSGAVGGAAVVGSAVVAVGAVEYIKTTITAWYKKLTLDIAGCTNKGEAGKQEVEDIIRKANEEIALQLKDVSSKAEVVSDKETAVQLSSTIEWAHGIIKESSTQIQEVSIEAITTGKSQEETRLKLADLTKSTENEIHSKLHECKETEIHIVPSKPVAIVHDSSKKVSHDDHTIAIVDGAVVTVGVIEYLKTTLSSWYKKLTIDIATCAGEGGSEADVDEIVRKANEEIKAELEKVTSKAGSNCDKATADKLTSTIDWAQGIIKESSNQVQAIGIQVIAAGETKEQAHAKMMPLVHATEEQVHTAFGQCTDVEIEIETEKVAVSHKGSEKPSVKPAHKEKEGCEKEKKSHHTGAVAVIGGTIVAVGALEYMKGTLSSWYNRLIADVSKCASHGGSAADIEKIVTVADEKITLELNEVSANIGKAGDKPAAVKIASTIEWAKGIVQQSSSQVQAIGIQVAASGESEESARLKMAPLVKATEEQVHTAFNQCAEVKIEIEHKESEAAVVVTPSSHDKSSEEKPKHKSSHHSDAVSTGAVVGGAVVAVSTIEYVKSTIAIWYGKLVSDIAECADHGEAGKQEIEKIIVKANEQITLELNDISSKAEATEDKVNAGKLNTTIGWAQELIKDKSTKLQTAAIGAITDGDNKEQTHAKMTAFIKDTEDQIQTALKKHADVNIVVSPTTPAAALIIEQSQGTAHKEKPKPKQEATHKSSHHIGAAAGAAVVGGTLVTIGAIEYIKAMITSWHSKLASDVSKCAANGGTPAQIEEIVVKANEQITLELKDVSVKTDKAADKTTAGKLTETIGWAQGIIKQSSTQIQAIGVQVVDSGESEESARAKMAPLVKATDDQIHVALDHCTEVRIEVSEKSKPAAAIVVAPDAQKKTAQQETNIEISHGKTTHNVGPVIGGVAVVGGAAVAVSAVEYIKSTISAWFSKLTLDVSTCAGKGEAGKLQINEIIRNANLEIETELKQITSKSGSAGDKEAAAKLQSTIEWAQTMVTQGSAQVQSAAIEVTDTGVSKEEAHDKIVTVAKVTEEQIHTAFDRCPKVTIEIDTHKASIICHKDSKTDETIAKKPETQKEHKESKEHKGSKEHTKLKDNKEGAAVAGALVAVGAVAYIKTTLSAWYQKLILDVSKCAAHGGNAADIEKIVIKANEEIALELKDVSDKASKSDDKTGAGQLTSIIGWAQGMIKQSSNQVQAIGIQASAAGESEESARLKMTPLVKATEDQIHVALGQCSEDIKVDLSGDKHEQHDKAKAAAIIVGAGAAAAAVAAKIAHDKKDTEESSHKEKEKECSKPKKSDECEKKKHDEKEKECNKPKKSDECEKKKHDEKEKECNKPKKSDECEKKKHEEKEKECSKPKKSDECEKKKHDEKEKECSKPKKSDECEKKKHDEKEKECNKSKKSDECEKKKHDEKEKECNKPKKSDECEKKKHDEKEKECNKPKKSDECEKKKHDEKEKECSKPKKSDECEKDKHGAGVVHHTDKEKTKSEHEKKSDSHEKKKLASSKVIEAELDIVVIIRAWFTSLIDDISEYSNKGWKNKIGVVVPERIEQITNTLDAIEVNSKETSSGYASVVAWAKSVVTQGATQIQAVAIQAAKKRDCKDELISIAASIEEQVATAVRPYQQGEAVEKHTIVKDQPEKSVDHIKQDVEKHDEYIKKPAQHTEERPKKDHSTMEDLVKGGLAVGAVAAGALAAGAAVHEHNKHKAEKQKADQEKSEQKKSEQHKAEQHESVIATRPQEVKQPEGKKVETHQTVIVGKPEITQTGGETVKTHETVVVSKSPAPVAQKAAQNAVNSFSVLIEKISLLVEHKDAKEAQVESEKLIIATETEITTTLEAHLNEVDDAEEARVTTAFLGGIRSSIRAQLEAIRSNLQQQHVDKAAQKAALAAITLKLTESISQQTVIVEETTDIVVDDQEVIVNKPSTTTVETVVTEKHGTVVDDTKPFLAICPSKPVTTTTGDVIEHKVVAVVDAGKIEKTKAQVDGWFALLIERITTYCKQDGKKSDAHIAIIISDAQAELDGIIIDAKSGVDASAENDFGATLEWIRSTATAQVSQVETIAVQSVKNSTDVSAQLANLKITSQKQIDHALEAHLAGPSTEETTKVVQVIQETPEETQERVQKEVTIVTKQIRLSMAAWLDKLLSEVRAAIARKDSEEQVLKIIAIHQQEADSIIEDAKAKYAVVGGASAAQARVDTKVTGYIANAQAQALNCLDSFKGTVAAQITSLQQVVTRPDKSDIEERVTSRIALIRERTDHALEYAAGAAVAAAFAGKTVTWVETSSMPASFAGVRAFAFDLVGTVTDYQETVGKAIRAVVKSDVDVEAFVEAWYARFLELKKEKKALDQELLALALGELLKKQSLQLSDADLINLCSAWYKLSVFQDASAGIKRIKSQRKGELMAISFSRDFSTRSMIDLARHGCLCWHAQFSGEMFSSGSVISGMSQLVGYDNSQVAVVSANPAVLSEAKSEGYKTVLIHRAPGTSGQTEFDVELDGIDMLAESLEVVSEQASSEGTTTSNTTWFQRVVDTVQRTIVG